MSRDTEVRAEESFPIMARGSTRGELLDSMDCEILIYTGTSKSYVSKSYFMQCKSLHAMPSMTAKGCRSFAGMLNFLSILCAELQKLLKPIYDLTKKGRHFIWEQSNKRHLKR